MRCSYQCAVVAALMCSCTVAAAHASAPAPARMQRANVIVTTSGWDCVFPFAYGGVTHDTCTTADNDGVPWCATTVDDGGEYS